MAALTHGDVASALSFNALVVVLLPIVVGAWGLTAGSVARGTASSVPGVGNRGWAVLLVVLLAFAVWRNLPGLPLGAALAP